MGKIETGPHGFLANRTNTKEIWIKGNVTTYIDINPVRKKKGKNYRKGHPCMVCDKPRFNRGRLCNKCRNEILKEAGA